jgi:PAS domain S-box-containing protein
LERRVRELESQVKALAHLDQHVADPKNAGESLREQERFAHKVLNSSLNGLYVYDVNQGQNVFINREYTRITGYTLKDISTMGRKQFSALFHPDDRPGVAEHMERLRGAGDEMLEVEYRFKTKDGRWIWCLSRDTVSARDEKGAVTQFLGTFLDITARKEVEESLRRQYELLAGINRISETVVGSASDEEFGTVCLAVAEKLTGSPISFLGEIGSDGLFHDIAVSNAAWEACSLQRHDDRRRHPRNFHIHGIYGSALLNGTPVLTNDPGSHPDRIGLPPGHPRLTSFLGVPFKQSGKTVGMIAVGNRQGGYGPEQQAVLEALGPVISEALARRRATEALQDSEQRLKRAQEIAHLGSWELDLTNNELTWSDEVYRIFGLEPREFEATYEAFLDHVHPEDRTAVDEAYSNSVHEGRDSYEIEHRVVRKDTGKIRWVHEKCQHMRNKDGRIIRSLGMVLDITERKEAQEALEGAHDELEEKVAERTAELQWRNRELQEFASVASHDLQEPLRKIQAFGDMLQRELPEALSDSGKDYLSRMIGAAGRMRKLIKALLAYSRVSTKASPFKRVDLKELTEKVVEDIDVSKESAEPVIEIGDLPAIDADPIQISQLLQNLIANAIRYSKNHEAPRVKISGRRVTLPKTGKKTHCELLVEDNGIGFDMAHLDRIFRPFERLHGRSGYTGTGMGLAICRKIAERHGGDITARGKPGEGATFIVTLPIRQTGRTNLL